MLGWSGLLAVIATNCVIASYVVMAWNEDDGKEKKTDAKGGNKLKNKPTAAAPIEATSTPLDPNKID